MKRTLYREKNIERYHMNWEDSLRWVIHFLFGVCYDYKYDGEWMSKCYLCGRDF